MSSNERDRLVALVPMRHDSERVRGKNYRPFGDERPLFHHIVATLESCSGIDRIVIDTDSPVIAEQCAESFPEVVVLERPEHLRAGEIPMNDVLVHDATEVEADFYLQTHSTNPLLRPATLERAIETFFNGRPDHDSLFGVTRAQSRFYAADGRPVNHDPAVLIRTQDLPPFYEENSCVYLFDRETLLERGNRLGQRPAMFEIERLEATDIDEEIDFDLAELIFRRGVTA